MIEAVDERLKDWISKIEKGTTVSFAPPGKEDGESGVGLYLIDLLPDPALRGSRQAPLQFVLRYLVTVRSKDPLQAHKLLGRLVFEALDNPDLEVDLSPPSAELWSALGVAPRPCFFIRSPVRRERPEPKHPLVRVPLEVRQAPMTNLSGQVLGPGDVPLRDAIVEWRGTVSERTGSSGRFRLTAPANGDKAAPLRVRLRRREFVFPSPPEIGEGQPMIIRLGEMEV